MMIGSTNNTEENTCTTLFGKGRGGRPLADDAFLLWHGTRIEVWIRPEREAEENLKSMVTYCIF